VSDVKFAILVLIGLALFVTGAFGLCWYQAGLQQEVYKRQGCEMTQWEVFMGAEPIDRQMVPVK
jgi:hypothetical protein